MPAGLVTVALSGTVWVEVLNVVEVLWAATVVAAGLTDSVGRASGRLEVRPAGVDRLDRVLAPQEAAGQWVGRTGRAVAEIGTLMYPPIGVVPLRTVKVTVASLTVPAVLVTVA